MSLDRFVASQFARSSSWTRTLGEKLLGFMEAGGARIEKDTGHKKGDRHRSEAEPVPALRAEADAAGFARRRSRRGFENIHHALENCHDGGFVNVETPFQFLLQ